MQGRSGVAHLVTGVTASLALIEAAVAAGADALLVHHGLFWRGQDGRITGWMHQRIKALITHDINLLAYHLPLDAHTELGNNAQLARVLGLEPLPVKAAGVADAAAAAQPQALAGLANRTWASSAPPPAPRWASWPTMLSSAWAAR